MNMWILEADTPGADTLKDAIRFKDKVWNWFTDADMWADVLFAGLRILVIFLLTRVIIKIVSNIIDRSLERKNRWQTSVQHTKVYYGWGIDEKCSDSYL